MLSTPVFDAASISKTSIDLPDDIFKDLWPELSSDNLVFHEEKSAADCCSAEKTGSGGYCVTLVYPIPLLPSGPGGVFGLQLHSPPKPVPLSGRRLSGESGIRTHGGVTPTHAFQACSLNHSDISPIFRSKLTFRLYHNWSCTVAAVYDRRTSLKTGRTGS